MEKLSTNIVKLKAELLAIQALQIELIKQEGIPSTGYALTGFGFFRYLESNEGQARLKKLQIIKK